MENGATGDVGIIVRVLAHHAGGQLDLTGVRSAVYRQQERPPPCPRPALRLSQEQELLTQESHSSDPQGLCRGMTIESWRTPGDGRPAEPD